jgi:cell division septation protein DedD
LNQALKDYARAIEINPFFVDAYNNRAWILATCSDRRLRDGKQAVRLAQKAVELKPDVGSLDTLAAAYAAVGNFDAAIETQKKAIQKLIMADKASEVPGYMAHLDTYRSGQSLRVDYAGAAEVSKTPNLDNSLQKQDKDKSSPPAKTHQSAGVSETRKSAAGPTRDLKTSLKKQTKKTSSPPAKTHQAVSALKTTESAADPQAKKISTPQIKPLPYTIQVSAFRDAQKSNQVARKLITGGDPAFTSPVDLPGKGKWSRVYIGNYKTLAEAKIAAADLKRRKFRYVNITKQPYTIQVGLPGSRDEAQQLKSRLKAKGYLAYSLPAGDNRNQIRVVVGAFENEQAAANLSGQLKKDGFSPKIGLK